MDTINPNKKYIKEVYSVFNDIEDNIIKYHFMNDPGDDETMDRLIYTFNNISDKFNKTHSFLTSNKRKLFYDNFKETTYPKTFEDELFLQLEYVLFSLINSDLLTLDKNYYNLILRSYHDIIDSEFQIKEIKRVLDILVKNKELKKKLMKKNNYLLTAYVIECLHDGYNEAEVLMEIDDDEKMEIKDFTIDSIFEYYYTLACNIYLMTDSKKDEANIVKIERIKELENISPNNKKKFIELVKENYNNNKNFSVRSKINYVAELIDIFCELKNNHVLSSIEKENINIYLTGLNKENKQEKKNRLYEQKNNFKLVLVKGGNKGENR